MSAASPHSLRVTPAFTNEPLFRLSVEAYHDLIRSGKLTEDDPVELLEGLIVFKMPKHPPHVTATGLARQAVEALLPTGWHYRAQEPLTLVGSEPEPDGAVVRGGVLDYGSEHPGPRDVAMVVEIADASLTRDRTIKRRIYALAGVPVYWIINLNDRQVEVHSDPDPDTQPEPTYRRREVLGDAGRLTVTLAGRALGEIDVARLLPP